MLPDEPLWITAGAQAFELLTDTARPGRWEQEPLDAGLASFGNANPPVGKYWIGAWALALRGPGDPLDYAWDPDDGPRESAARGQLPSRELVLGVRSGIALLGAGCLLLVYTLARQVSGARWLALLAPLLLFTTPAFAESATTVHTDVPQLFLLLAGAALWLEYLRRGGRARLALAGAALGLSCAAKYSSAPALIGALLFAVLRQAAWRERAQQLAALGLGALAAFWLSTPYLYTQPIAKQLTIVEEWSRIEALQRQEPALRRQAISGAFAGLARSAQRALLRPTHPALPGAHLPPGPVNAIGALALLGAAALAGASRATAAAPQPRADAGRALLALIGCTWLLTGLWLPFDWPRYYLPLLVLTPALPVAALAAALRWFSAPRPDAAEQADP